MQPFKNLLIGVSVFMSLAVEADQLTIERIYSSPSLSGQSIQGLKLSPDGKRQTRKSPVNGFMAARS